MRAPLLLLGLASASCWTPRAAAQADALVAELGDPPDFDAVRRLVRAADEDPQTACALAARLAARGGHAAAQGLFDLVRHRDPGVRIAALQGVAEVALRRADGIDSVRKALLDSNADVRANAYVAIGRVGNASDLPALIEALASDDERTRAAADRALSTLTGISLSSDDPGGWSDWWRESRVILPGRLTSAIHELELGGGPVGLRDARQLLAQQGWFDVARVEEAARGWLRSVDARRRAEGYRMAARCRLGDLADDVRRAAHDEFEPDLIFLALCSAKVLGVAVDGLSLPATVCDVQVLLAADQSESEAELAASADMQRIAQERLRVEEERLAAVATRGAGGAVHAGRSLGGVVWLDLDAKRERARSAAAKRAAAAAGPRGATPLPSTSLSSWSFTWIGFPVVIVTIGLGFFLAMRRKSGEETEETRPSAASSPVAAVAWMGDEPGEVALARELRNARLLPACLAAAGVRPREVGAVVGRAGRWLSANFERLRSLRSRGLVARARRDELKELVSSEKATPQEHERWQEAAAECVRLEPELAATLDSFFDAATAALSTESKATLVRIRANGAGSTLPANFLVVERSEADRARIEEALRNEDEARKRNRDVEPADLGWLKRARSDLAVWHAQLNVNELLAGVTEAWERALVAAAAAADSAAESAAVVEPCDAAAPVDQDHPAGVPTQV
jgi:hypothetical protein